MVGRPYSGSRFEDENGTTDRDQSGSIFFDFWIVTLAGSCESSRDIGRERGPRLKSHSVCLAVHVCL
jgi:hypothetical protein